MARDPLARMDIDTRWPYHRKCRTLQAAHPFDWPSYWCAYLAVLGESWAGTERVTLRDAWVPSLPVTIDAAQAALIDAGLLDKSGKVPVKSWDEWFGPAMARIDSLSERGRKGAERRWGKRDKHPIGHRPSNGPAIAEPSSSNGQRMHHASQPTTPTTPTSDDAHAVMLLVEELTTWGFDYRQGHRVFETLVKDVAAHGAAKIEAEYRAFRVANPGPMDPPQLVFGVHNALHPFASTKAPAKGKGFNPTSDEAWDAFGGKDVA